MYDIESSKEQSSLESSLISLEVRIVPTYLQLPDNFELRLKAIEQLAKNEKGGVSYYLSNADCPYSEEAKIYINKLINDNLILPSIDIWQVDDQGDKFDIVLREVEKTINDMKTLESQLNLPGEDVEPGDRIQFFKAKTALLEKWTTLKERIYSLKEMSHFQSIILQFMDEVLDVDQRTKFLERLRNLRSIPEVENDIRR